MLIGAQLHRSLVPPPTKGLRGGLRSQATVIIAPRATFVDLSTPLHEITPLKLLAVALNKLDYYYYYYGNDFFCAMMVPVNCCAGCFKFCTGMHAGTAIVPRVLRQ